MNLSKVLPPNPSNVLERDRLVNKLVSWENKRLVLIHAHAGQGKSTLAAAYVRSCREPAAWYNLDQEDDNPGIFLSCLGKALQRTFPQQIAELPPAPQNRYAGSMQQDINRWIDQVFKLVSQPGLIVFDEFSTTSESPIMKEMITTLVNAAPRCLRFIILSRVRPELDIAKLRAAGAVGELTADDLRFSNSEVQDLFTAVFRLQISESEAALINSSIEGWPAGLVLMHEYLSSLSPEARPLAIADRRSTGFRTHVFDYLAQEVFSHLPVMLQHFLLSTSITDHLPLPLMEQLSGLPRSARQGERSVEHMVNELRSRNLFVTFADEGAAVIRYLALFR